MIPPGTLFLLLTIGLTAQSGRRSVTLESRAVICGAVRLERFERKEPR
jgi:hypothetical protein